MLPKHLDDIALRRIPTQASDRRSGRCDWSRLLDLVRATIVVDPAEEVDEVVQALRHGGLRLARVPKDRFTNPTAVGYRDLMLNVTLPNGIVGELQVHVKSMLAAKAQGHTPYEVMRAIEAKYRQSDPMRSRPESTWSPEDQAAWRRAFRQSCVIYGRAWLQQHRATGGTPMDSHEHFEREGAYFRKPRGALGGPREIWHRGENRWVPYTGDPTKVLVDGNPVSAHEVARQGIEID